MQRLKDLLEIVHEWPAKCENHKCFLSREFPVIWYCKVSENFCLMKITLNIRAVYGKQCVHLETQVYTVTNTNHTDIATG